MHRVRLSVAAALAASLVLAGCGGGDSDNGGDGNGNGKETGPESVLASTWPLTGLDVAQDQSAEQDHPVLVVKMDNTEASAPQIGLGKADLVVEELVEGGLTRLAAFYYSEIPANAGPVRSMRASDIGIVKPVGGVMVTSGAADVTINRLRKAGVKFHGEGATGMYRERSRRSPYDLMVRLGKLASSLEEESERPADYLPWGDPATLPAGQPATKVTASFSRGHRTNWAFVDGKYRNTNSHAAQGDRFLADTVLVLRVRVGDAGYTDPAGNPVPETMLEGTGNALLFHAGSLVRGTWSKPTLESPLTLQTQAGPLVVPPGRTFIELVPQGTGDVTFS